MANILLRNEFNSQTPNKTCNNPAYYLLQKNLCPVGQHYPTYIGPK